MRIVLTGVSGFVGQGLLKQLLQAQHQVTAVVRRPCLMPGVQRTALAELSADQDWRSILAEQDCLIHCAARVHVMRESATDALAEYRKVNVQGTLHLAQQAAAAGLKRFIFLSSIKVNGEASRPGQPYRAEDPAAPLDAYGQSKYEAELGLQALAAETGMQVVIIRPVLIYGPGVKANLQRLMEWINRGIPLPLAALDNRRSLLALDNLADLVLTCIQHPAAANQVFLASDGEDLSTPALIRQLAEGLGKPARLLPVPLSWLRGAAKLPRLGAPLQRLCGSLQVDIQKTRQLLNWTPPVRIHSALRQTARAFLGHSDV